MEFKLRVLAYRCLHGLIINASVTVALRCTGYQYAGASSSNCAALCTPYSTGRAQRICQTLLSPSVQAVHVPDYVPLRRRTSHCHGCAQSSANVHLATLVPLRGTTCLKICAPLTDTAKFRQQLKTYFFTRAFNVQ